MTFEKAMALSKLQTLELAKWLAITIDPNVREKREKILSQIEKHRKAITKLEGELESYVLGSAYEWESAARRKKKEAEDYIQAAIEVELKERKGRS